MPMRLEGSCRCAAVKFALDSHTPYPYQRCYCSICRKSAGGGGYAINIMGDTATLKIEGRRAIRKWHAIIDGEQGSAERSFCRQCGTASHSRRISHLPPPRCAPNARAALRAASQRRTSKASHRPVLTTKRDERPGARSS